jgi:hypothetical protein
MKSDHGTDFSQRPDLIQFRPELFEKDEKGDLDIYGCAKATREHIQFNGVAVVHTLLEHGEWVFTGCSFTEFPNEPCKALSDPHWEPDSRMGWSEPMQEVRDFKMKGTSVHVDPPH